MRIVDANFIYDENIKTEEQQLKQHYTIVGWAEALQRKGSEMIVVKRFSKESSFVINNVSYHFIKDRFKGHLKTWQLPFKLLKK